MRSPVAESVEVALADRHDPRWKHLAEVMARPLWYSRRDARGRFLAIGWTEKSYAFFSLDFAREELVFASDNMESLELDPDVGEILQVLARHGLSTWRVSTRHWTPRDHWHRRPWGWVGQLSAACKTRHEVSRVCEWERFEEPAFGRFRYRALRHVSDLVFYHATRKSLLRSTKGRGLLPAKLARAQFDGNTTHLGWTQLNFDLQDAIYLTANADYAGVIAETLADRWEEPSVVVAVKGSDLNPLHLTFDEDALRSKYHGEVSDEGCLHGIPAYFSSLLWGEHLSVAYLDWIPASKLRFVHEELPQATNPRPDPAAMPDDGTAAWAARQHRSDPTPASLMRLFMRLVTEEVDHDLQLHLLEGAKHSPQRPELEQILPGLEFTVWDQDGSRGRYTGIARVEVFPSGKGGLRVNTWPSSFRAMEVDRDTEVSVLAGKLIDRVAEEYQLPVQITVNGILMRP